MRVSVGAKTDVGRHRQANEDSYLAQEPLFVVADGMGGHAAGDVASSTAVDRIRDEAGNASASDPESLAQLIRRANAAIWEKSQADPSLHSMGTTCTLVLLDATKAHIAHVGDSRAYLFREGALEQLTEDHTLVERLVKEGRLKPEEAEHHPQRSIITRALGVDSDVDVDLIAIDLKDGDRVILCSDGLSSMIDKAAIGRVLESEQDPQSAAEELINAANEAGGEDNITVLVLDMQPDGVMPDAASTDARGAVILPQPAEEPEPEPERAQTDPEIQTRKVGRRHRRRGSNWLVPILLLLLLLGITAAGGWYVVNNSFYVGANEDDRLAVYRGIRDEVAGFSFKSPEDVSEVAVTDLPEFMRSEVRQGMEEDSLSDARQTLRNLEARAEEFQRQQANERRRDKARDRKNTGN